MKRALPFLVIGGVALLLVAISLATPRPYDPRLRAERAGTEPFDSEVLYRLLPDWLGAPVEAVDVTPFERLADSTISGAAYVFVTDDFAPDPAEADRLLRFVRQGNTLVVAAQYVGGPLFEALGEPASSSPYVPDTLGADAPLSEIYKQSERDSLDTHGVYMDDRGGPAFDAFEFDETDDGSEDDTGGGVLGADTLYVGREARAFPVPLDGGLIYGLDSTRTAVLSLTDLSGGVPTAVAIAEGRGRVVLASTPLAFTNAAIAGQGQGAAYLAGLFAYVPPVRLVLWDDTYKPLRDRGSQVAFALRTPALRWALWLVGIGAVLGVLVWGRRRQRPIPVVAPPPNAQREFARTVGRLFFVRGDRAWLAARKRRHLEDALRRQLGIADADLSDATARRAAARAGVPEDDALALFARLRDLATDPDPAPTALLRADRDIDAFFAARHLEASDATPRMTPDPIPTPPAPEALSPAEALPDTPPTETPDAAFDAPAMLAPVARVVDGLRGAIGTLIVGQEGVIDELIAALLAGGHVLVEGVPGVAKTLTAKLLARASGMGYSRVQFTPDLMPSDVLGTQVFSPKTGEFSFHEGPVFAQVVLIDEINRAPAKTQAALFEVMEERQATIDGTTYPMPAPFMVLATQNPVEHEGTYRLPEAQLDRFLFKTLVGYPSLDDETEMLRRFQSAGGLVPLSSVQAVLTPEEIEAAQAAVRGIRVDDAVLRYAAEIVAATRRHPALSLGASPRASLALVVGAKAVAAMSGRAFATPDDVRTVVAPALRHRVQLTPEREIEGVRPADVLRRIVEEIDVPR